MAIVSVLKQKLADLLAQNFKDGILGSQYELIHSLHGDKDPWFTVVAIKMFSTHTEQRFGEINEKHMKPHMDIPAITIHVEAIKGSSLRIGSDKLTKACRDFLRNSNANNVVGCHKAMMMLNHEFNCVKGVFQKIIELERWINIQCGAGLEPALPAYNSLTGEVLQQAPPTNNFLTGARVPPLPPTHKSFTGAGAGPAPTYNSWIGAGAPAPPTYNFLTGAGAPPTYNSSTGAPPTYNSWTGAPPTYNSSTGAVAKQALPTHYSLTRAGVPLAPPTYNFWTGAGASPTHNSWVGAGATPVPPTHRFLTGPRAPPAPARPTFNFLTRPGAPPAPAPPTFNFLTRPGAPPA